jgi:hypothetical protein
VKSLQGLFPVVSEEHLQACPIGIMTDQLQVTLVRAGCVSDAATKADEPVGIEKVKMQNAKCKLGFDDNQHA